MVERMQAHGDVWIWKETGYSLEIKIAKGKSIIADRWSCGFLTIKAVNINEAPAAAGLSQYESDGNAQRPKRTL